MSAQKRKPLDTAALGAAAVQQPDPVQLAIAKPGVEQPRRAGGSRADRVQIQGHYPEETRRQFKMLAARLDRTVENLLGEAIADVMTKYAPKVN